MSKRPTHFCRSIEQVLGLAAVMRVWQHQMADDWSWGRSYLRPTGQVADCFPKDCADPSSQTAYHIVWRDEEADRYVGSCPEGTSRIDLRRADLVVYELDVRALASRIASAMGLISDFGDINGVSHAVRIGAKSPMTDDEVWIYMALQMDPQQLTETFAQLSVRHERPFVLLTPTRVNWRTWPDAFRRRGQISSIEESFTVSAAGEWQLTAGMPPAPAEPILSVFGGPAPNTTPTAASYVPDRNEMAVLRILAAAKTMLVQEEIVAATAEVGRRLSRKTVGKVLQSLAHQRLVDQQPGTRKGVSITNEGRSIVTAASRSSH